MIEAIQENLHVSEYHSIVKNGYILYQSKNSPEWYEIDGIEFKNGSIDKAKIMILNLGKSEKISGFLYCLSSNRIEPEEIKLLNQVRNNFPNVKVAVIMTQCINDSSVEISKILKNINVIPVLAKEYVTRGGIVPPYGIEQILNYLREGES